jgi:rhodanese-related sulfurtransferase
MYQLLRLLLSAKRRWYKEVVNVKLQIMNAKKRLAIGSVLFGVILIAAVALTRDRDYTFQVSDKETLSAITDKSNFISEAEMRDIVLNNTGNYILVDVRNPHEYSKDHINGSVNMPARNLLSEESLEFFGNTDKTCIIYCAGAVNTNQVWMTLYQLGYKDIKAFIPGHTYIKEKILNNNRDNLLLDGEKPRYDYAKEATPKEGSATVVKNEPKRQPIVKRKKKMVEGGC